MSGPTITPLENGPYRIDGPVRLLDATGNSVAEEHASLFLCRCGGSSSKPFCDGTHIRDGFRAAGANAGPPSSG